MKNRAFAIAIFLLGTFIVISTAQADPPPPRYPKTMPFQGSGGRDISENAWQNWQAPVGTMDPSRLIPDGSTNLMAADGLPLQASDPSKAVSLDVTKFASEGKPIQVAQTKPIEMSETEHTSQTDASHVPVLASAVQKPKNDSKRIITIAALSVAILAYRKFRRAHSKSHPPKPSFL